MQHAWRRWKTCTALLLETGTPPPFTRRDEASWKTSRYYDEINSLGVDWINLALDRTQCRALVNTAIKFSVP
jgi:hypothetical protein